MSTNTFQLNITSSLQDHIGCSNDGNLLFFCSEFQSVFQYGYELSGYGKKENYPTLDMKRSTFEHNRISKGIRLFGLIFLSTVKHLETSNENNFKTCTAFQI